MSIEPLYRIELLSRQHDKESFRCGVESLDLYLRTQASQDMRRKANAVFVLLAEEDPHKIAGYFTLCAYGLAPGVIPEMARKHIPKYPVVSATLIGRLAISLELQGKGLGAMLLARALTKAYENSAVVGSCMVVVDAIDESAVHFYQSHGFIKLPESMRLILPMRTLASLLGG